MAWVPFVCAPTLPEPGVGEFNRLEDWRVCLEETSGWKRTRCGGACRRPSRDYEPIVSRRRPNMCNLCARFVTTLTSSDSSPCTSGSSMSIFSSFGVFTGSRSEPSPSLSLSTSFAELSASRPPGMRKFSSVRFSKSPPLAVTSSRISFGGGSLLWMLVISYALASLSAWVSLSFEWHGTIREVFVICCLHKEGQACDIAHSRKEFSSKPPPS